MGERRVPSSQEEHFRVDATLKKMIRREKRRLIKETREMLLHEPFGDRARAMKEEKCNRQRWIQMGARNGKQVASAAFTKHLEEMHAQ